MFQSRLPHLDTIWIRNLSHKALVGIHPHERNGPQEVWLSACFYFTFNPSTAHDHIENTLNYQTLAELLREKMASMNPFLLETMIYDLMRACFELDERILAIEMSLAKPHVLRDTQEVGVTLFRKRECIESFFD
jgi:dihydroneopterin aldolase